MVWFIAGAAAGAGCSELPPNMELERHKKNEDAKARGGRQERDGRGRCTSEQEVQRDRQNQVRISHLWKVELLRWRGERSVRSDAKERWKRGRGGKGTTTHSTCEGSGCWLNIVWFIAGAAAGAGCSAAAGAGASELPPNMEPAAPVMACPCAGW